MNLKKLNNLGDCSSRNLTSGVRRRHLFVHSFILRHMEIHAPPRDLMNLLSAAQENVLWKDLDFDNDDEHRMPSHKFRYFNPLNGRSSSVRRTTRDYVVTIGANGLFTALITFRTANGKSGNELRLHTYVFILIPLWLLCGPCSK